MLWILFLIICGIIVYIIKISFYWANKGVMQMSPWNMWKYNLISIFQLKPTAQVVLELQSKYKNNRYIGTYQFFQQILILKDPNLIKQIGIKDFDHFVDHQQFVQEETEPLWGKNLFLLTGERWKDMRSTLSPSFTSSKMRGMFELINESTEQFLKYLEKKESSTITIELKDAFTRFATDVTASAAFGLSCDSLTNPNNEFYLMGQEVTDLSGFWKNVAILLMGLVPRFANFFGITFTSTRANTFFRYLVKSTVETRERNGIIRPDMIHLLMEARKGRLKHDISSDAIDSGFAVIQESAIDTDERRRKLELTDDDLTAQALLFFFAGVDTVSALMCFTVHELAVNYEIQKRLQSEIDDTLLECEGVVTYESLLKMKYLDMVISEALRKYPNTVVTDRICVKPYVIKPINEGEKPVYLNKDDLVWIPIYSIHHDPNLYPEPDRFDPERFNDENKSNIQPHSYLPFGIGPRSCIGNRFALLESKLLIFKLLAHYSIVVVEKTQIPIKFPRNQFTLGAENGFWVGFEERLTNSH